MMNKKNAYTESIIGLKDKELIEYIDHYEIYQEGAVIAAIYELENRGLASSEYKKLLEKLEKEYSEEEPKPTVKTPRKLSLNFEPKIRKDTDTSLPKLYTRNVVLVFSILFSTFFGSILMAINLNRLKKEKEALYVILFGLIFTYSTSYLIGRSGINLFIFPIIVNVAGAYLMDFLFWKKHIGMSTAFQPQPIKGLLLVVSIIFLIFLFAVMKNPELMDTLLNQSALQ